MRIEPNKRYIIDTNVWINAISEGKPHYTLILKYCINEAFIICPLNNLVEIIHRLTMMNGPDKKWRKRENGDAALELLIDLINKKKITIVFPSEREIFQAIEQYKCCSEIQIFDYMIAYSGIGKADYIISEDHHFENIFGSQSNVPLERADYPIVVRPNDLEVP